MNNKTNVSPLKVREIPAVVVIPIAICFLFFIAGVGMVFAQNNPENDFEYGWDKNVQNGIEITKYVGSGREVRIPPTIKNYKVTSIGNGSFRGNKNVTGVVIPSGVTSISRAFQNCTALASITIPNTVTTIGERAFEGCTSLSSVTIPNSVTTIGVRAFDGCTSLARLAIPNSVTTIGDYAFNNCSSLATVTTGNGVTTIGEFAFNSCTSLSSVTIGNNVASIGRGSFQNCTSLASITIPKSVSTIYVIAFKDCTSLNSVTFQGSIAAKDFGGLGVTSVRLSTVDLFPGNLIDKYLDRDGGPGTYIRFANTKEWRKQI